MLRAALVSATVALMPLSVSAQTAGDDDLDPLMEAMGISEVLEIMREEGIAYGGELAADLFGGAGPGNTPKSWAATVGDIYSIPRLEASVRVTLAEELAGSDTDAMLAFFESDLGQRIIGLEVSARRAMLEEDVEDASRDLVLDMIETQDPRLDLLETFTEINDLIENNVVGAMNANFAFYTGLADGGAFEDEFTEDQMLSDVWSQEDAIRDDTVDWVYAYLALAYRPLSDADLQAYIDFSETEPGAVLNQALFTAFDDMFVSVSLALGRAAAGHMAGEEL